jgi:hypothetical protein
VSFKLEATKLLNVILISSWCPTSIQLDKRMGLRRTRCGWYFKFILTTGYIANSFLDEKIRLRVNAALVELSDRPDLPPLTLSNGFVPNWPDKVLYDKRYHGKYSWSKRLHYVDTGDHPEDGNCSFIPARDRGDDVNIVSAIANYTTRVGMCKVYEPGCGVDVAFLAHFIGDVGQPLHVCGMFIIDG